MNKLPNDTVFLVCRMGGGTAMSAEYIVNGDFETGDLTGWDVWAGGPAAWVLNDGNVVPPGDSLPPPYDSCGQPLQPISGNYDALAIQWDVSLAALFQQTITLPSNITSATLSWSDRILNYAGFLEDIGAIEEAFVDPIQEFRVFIVGESSVLHEIFSTEPGDEHLQFGPNSRSFDLTDLAQALEGQQVFVAFEMETAFFFMNIAVDDISLDIDSVLPVEIDIKPGSEPNCFNNDGHGVIPVAILGSAEFDVTTIDAGSVMLEGLAVKAVGKSNKLLAHYEDVDSDGYDDLVVQIEDDDLIFEEGDTTATVTGNLNNGMPIQGSDTICIVP